MRWLPDPWWQGRDAVVLGGGRSLKDFDFSTLKNENVVGCNDAYLYGPEVCNVCVFGDAEWFEHHHTKLSKYVKAGGFVVTNVTAMESSRIPWLHWMPRRPKGLHYEALGWNKNTGASAINLALLLGAGTIYLLGFDRKLINGRPNWHDEIIIKPEPEIYPNMNYADTYVKNDLKNKFPGRRVVNVTDGSCLDVWPKMAVGQFLERKR